MQGKQRHSVSPLNTQCFENFAESRERKWFLIRSALTLNCQGPSVHTALYDIGRECSLKLKKKFFSQTTQEFPVYLFNYLNGDRILTFNICIFTLLRTYSK